MSLKFIDENGVEKKPIDFGLAVLPNHEHEAIPETIDRTLSIPEKDGLLYYGSNLGAREFNIPMIVIPQENRIEMQKRIREFSGFVMDGYGRPKMLKIIFDYEPNVYYHVRLRGRVSPERYYRMAEFDLPLIADDPYAYSESNVYDQTGNLYDNGLIYTDYLASEIYWDSESIGFDNSLVFVDGEPGSLFYPNPVEIEWIEPIQYSGLYNYSTLNTSLEMTIEGEVLNPRIINQTSGKEMVISIYLKPGEKLKIQKHNVKHVGNGAEKDIFKYAAGDLIDLVEGKNDLVFKGGFPNATISYKWKHKHI
jgi:predicted phage tail component-like protein